MSSIVNFNSRFISKQKSTWTDFRESIPGKFGVGLLGDIDVAYISSAGKDYATAPALTPVYAGTVLCGATASSSCLMTQSVTQVVKGGGQTRGCGKGSVLVGSGGGGSGFEAVIIDADGLGEVSLLRITNHGAGYTSAPQLVMTVAGSCRCGSYIVNGEATSDSFLSAGVAGGLDACFTTVVALGGAFAGNGRRRNLRFSKVSFLPSLP